MIDPQSFFQSKKFSRALVVLGAIVLALLIFSAGVAVGFKKASFSYRWGENYHRNFGGPRGGFLVPFSGSEYENAHGAFGKIIKMELPTLTIVAPGQSEKSIVLSGGSVVRRAQETIKPSDLKLNDFIVVIGEGNSNGQIAARLVRVMPVPGIATSSPRQ